MNNQRTLIYLRARYERGVVLILALIVLVAMILAGAALMRSTDMTTRIAGNLAFRQSGVNAADAGLEFAKQWLTTTGADLKVDQLPSYYATANGGIAAGEQIFDPRTFNWAGKSALPTDAAGNTAVYVVHRMCDKAGDPGDTTTNCITAPGASSDGDSHKIDPTLPCPPGVKCTGTRPYYRITVKVTGLRNTVSYIQSVMY